MSVTVPANITGSSVEILKGAKKSNSARWGSESLDCSIDLKAERFDYTFSGNCVMATANGETQYLVP